jgi:hypothetical protein
MSKKIINKEYKELYLDNDFSDAQKILGKKISNVAVIFNDEHKPESMITGGDLSNINVSDDQKIKDIIDKLPPADNVEREELKKWLKENLSSNNVSSKSFRAIVTESGSIKGTFVHTSSPYVSNGGSSNTNMSLTTASRLAGRIVNQPIIMYCVKYGHRNVLDYYNRHKPPCCQSNEPHPHYIRN